MQSKPLRILITFDTHTPYLAFRVRELQRAVVERGWQDRVLIEVILIALEETTYKWEAGELTKLYGGVPVRVMSDKFRGLQMRDWFRWTTFKTTLRLAWHYLKARPKVALVGGYDRPESMMLAFLSILTRGKVGPLHDSRFNDAEAYAKSVWLEFAKGFVLRRYHFFMCSGRECAEYSRFLGGRHKPVFTSAWDIVDNEKIGLLAECQDRDAAIQTHFGLTPEQRYFFMPIRFLPKKNAAFVIAAYAAAARRAEDAGTQMPVLILCGQGPLENELRSQISRMSLEDRVLLRPWLPYDDVPRACRMAEALLLASTHDQWGMTINEALAAGAPVLCSSRAGAHELVRNYVNGFTFHPWDESHLAELFYTLATDPALVARLRQQAAASVREFSVRQWLAACFAVMELFGKLPQLSAEGHVLSLHAES